MSGVILSILRELLPTFGDLCHPASKQTADSGNGGPTDHTIHCGAGRPWIVHNKRDSPENHPHKDEAGRFPPNGSDNETRNTAHNGTEQSPANALTRGYECDKHLHRSLVKPHAKRITDAIAQCTDEGAANRRHK
jgi:hypothetical protein